MAKGPKPRRNHLSRKAMRGVSPRSLTASRVIHRQPNPHQSSAPLVRVEWQHLHGQTVPVKVYGPPRPPDIDHLGAIVPRWKLEAK